MRYAVVALLIGLTGCSSKDATPAGHAPATAPSVVQSAPTSKAPTSKAPTSKASPKVVMIPVPIELPPEVVSRGKTMAQDIRDDLLDRRALRDRRNAGPFLYVAATHPDPTVVTTALKGMAATHVRQARPEKDERAVDEAYAKVVEARLTAKPPQVRAAAITATGLLIGGKTPRAGWIQKVLSHLKTTPDVTDQVALLRILYTVRDFQLSKPTEGPIKAQVVAVVATLAQGTGPARLAALDLLGRVAYPELPLRNQLAKLAKALSADADAATRGVALALRVRLARPKDDVGPTLMAALKHESPYVRGVAIAGVGHLKYKPAVATLMTLIEDQTSCDLEVEWTDTAQQRQHLKLRSGMGQSIAKTCFRALRAIAGGRLKIQPLKQPTAAKRARVRLEGLRAWYEANKATLK